MSKVENSTEAVANDVADELGIQHVVKQEKTIYIRSGYTWSTQYAKEKFEEQRTVMLPEGTSNDTVYAYQLLTGADLCHMVIFNAYNQGFMDEDEFLDILNSSKSILKKVLPYLKLEKEKKSEVYDEMLSIYQRVRTELVENGLLGKAK